MVCCREIAQHGTFTKDLFRFADLRDTVRISTFEFISFSHSADVVASPVVTTETLTCSVAEVALALGVSAPTVYRLITRRFLRSLDCLRHKRIPKRQVYALVSGSGRGGPWPSTSFKRPAGKKIGKLWVISGSFDL